MTAERINRAYSPAVYSNERPQQEARTQSPDPAERSPDQRRNEAIARKPRPEIQALGRKIDIYA